MKKRTPDKFWFPFWPDKWLFGSMRVECSVDERSIWMDLLSLASKDDGHIGANTETPYPLEQMAGMLIIPKDQLEAAIEKFLSMKDEEGNAKLIRTKYGTLQVTKWEKYQFSDRHKRRVEEEMSGKTDIVSGKKDPIIKENTLNENKEKNHVVNKFTDDDIKLTNLLIERILDNNSRSKVAKMTENQKNNWRNQCRLLREEDKWSVKEIETVIRFTQQDNFEMTNVLSMGKLRKRFDNLAMKARREYKKRSELRVGGK